MSRKNGQQNFKILVVGGAGYVGSRLVPYLVKKGHDVTVLDLFWFGNNLPSNVPIIKKDVFDVDEALLKGFDQVIFLAGLSNDPTAEYSPIYNFVNNSAAPAYLAYIAKRAGVKRFIYASSGSVYGFTKGNSLSENDLSPGLYHAYGISKRGGEFSVMCLQDENFSVVSLRKGTISGWSPRMRFDLIINTMYMKALTEGKLTVNNPTIWRPILAISDAVNAYIQAVSLPLAQSGVFNISSGNFTVGEIGQKVSSHIRIKYGKTVAVEIRNIPDHRNYKISTKKAEEVFGYKPEGTIESILGELDQNVGPDFDFLNENYYNIRVFEKLAKAGNLAAAFSKLISEK